MAGPRVSVVIPYYNSRWSIDRTLRSVRAQTFGDFEAIVVDDGSTDGLIEEIGPHLAADDRLRVVRQENAGLAGARNRGFAEARAELVAPIDADDMWHPDYLAAMVAALDAQPDAPFAYAYSWRVDEQDRLLPELHLARAPRHDFLGLLSLNSVGSGSAAVFRRKAVLALGGYDETLRVRAAQGAEDWKLIVRLAAVAPPALVQRSLVAYRLVAESMSQADPRRQLRAVLAVLGDLQAEFPATPQRCFRNARTMMIAWLLPAFLRKRRYGEAARQALVAYAANPLWFLDANIRAVHLARLRMALDGLARAPGAPRAAPGTLADALLDGNRPFAFLNESAVR